VDTSPRPAPPSRIVDGRGHLLETFERKNAATGATRRCAYPTRVVDARGATVYRWPGSRAGSAR